MFIIFGVRYLYSVLATGTFACPRCGADRGYRLKAQNRWFALFFIPLIPMGKTGVQVVECTTCHGTWQPNVLQRPTTSKLASDLSLAARAGVIHVLRSGAKSPTDGDLAAAVARLAPVAGDGYNLAGIQGDLNLLRAGDEAAYVRAVDTALSVQGKESMQTTMFRTALTMSGTSHESVAAATEVGQWLGLTYAHLNGIYDSVSGDVAAP